MRSDARTSLVVPVAQVDVVLPVATELAVVPALEMEGLAALLAAVALPPVLDVPTVVEAALPVVLPTKGEFQPQKSGGDTKSKILSIIVDDLTRSLAQTMTHCNLFYFEPRICTT